MFFLFQSQEFCTPCSAAVNTCSVLYDSSEWLAVVLFLIHSVHVRYVLVMTVLFLIHSVRVRYVLMMTVSFLIHSVRVRYVLMMTV